MKTVKHTFVLLFLTLVIVSVQAQQKKDLEPYYEVTALARSIEKSNAIDLKNRTALSKLPQLALAGDIVSQVLKVKDLNVGVFNDYYFLLQLKQGVSIQEATTKGMGNTSMSEEFNENYYKRIIYYLSHGGDEIKDAYLRQLEAVFRYNGYTKGLNEVLPFVKEKVKESKLKDEVLDLYKKYDSIQEGKAAPAFSLPNDCDQIISLSDFKGKVVVMDVWATWCHWCIAKMPHYIELKHKYQDNPNVVFLTVSIDSYVEKYEWRYTIPNIGLLGFVNLLGSAGQSSFQQDYMITGAPRYMVIDKKGNIVNLYLPGADSQAMSDAIDAALQ